MIQRQGYTPSLLEGLFLSLYFFHRNHSVLCPGRRVSNHCCNIHFDLFAIKTTEMCQLEFGTQSIKESMCFSCSFQFLLLLVSRYPSFLDFQISQTQEGIFRLLIDMIGHKFYVLKLMSMPVRFQEMVLLPLCFEESPWSPMSNKIHQLQSSKFCLYQLYLPDLGEFCSLPFLYSKLQIFFKSQK